MVRQHHMTMSWPRGHHVNMTMTPYYHKTTILLQDHNTTIRQDNHTILPPTSYYHGHNSTWSWTWYGHVINMSYEHTTTMVYDHVMATWIAGHRSTPYTITPYYYATIRHLYYHTTITIPWPRGQHDHTTMTVTTMTTMTTMTT